MTEWIARHSRNARICHWINAVAVVMLAVSGFAILLDYPELYWGKVGYKGHEPAFRLADVGITMEGSRIWGRNQHFLFSWIFAINGIVYLAWNLSRGEFRRKLLPRREQLARGHILADLKDHLRLRRARGEAAKSYNLLQKVSYLTILVVLSPLMVLTGLAQSPAFTTAVPDLLHFFGGKQSARTIHTVCTVLFMLFLVVHIFQVFVAGALNEIRAMITGKFAVEAERK